MFLARLTFTESAKDLDDILSISGPLPLPRGLHSLELVSLHGSTIPCGLDGLDCLTCLLVESAYNITSLPESLVSLRLLQQLQLVHLSELVSLPVSFGRLSSLEVLSLSCLPQLRELEVQQDELPRLALLNVARCPELHVGVCLGERRGVKFEGERTLFDEET